MCRATTSRTRIEKGSGANTDTASFDHLVYEAYAPGGIALIIETLTNNRNRTAPELRTILDKNGGALANTGSVAFQFDRRGEILIEAGQVTEDQLMELALGAGADDIQGDDTDGWQVLTDGGKFPWLRQNRHRKKPTSPSPPPASSCTRKTPSKWPVKRRTNWRN